VPRGRSSAGLGAAVEKEAAFSPQKARHKRVRPYEGGLVPISSWLYVAAVLAMY